MLLLCSLTLIIFGDVQLNDPNLFTNSGKAFEDIEALVRQIKLDDNDRKDDYLRFKHMDVMIKRLDYLLYTEHQAGKKEAADCSRMMLNAFDLLNDVAFELGEHQLLRDIYHLGKPFFKGTRYEVNRAASLARNLAYTDPEGALAFLEDFLVSRPIMGDFLGNAEIEIDCRRALAKLYAKNRRYDEALATKEQVLDYVAGHPVLSSPHNELAELESYRKLLDHGKGNWQAARHQALERLWQAHQKGERRPDTKDRARLQEDQRKQSLIDQEALKANWAEAHKRHD